MDEEINCVEFDSVNDGYKKRCGEIYLNVHGIMMFLCTLCEKSSAMHHGFEDYAQHVEKDHKSILFTLVEDNTSVESIGKNVDISDYSSNDLFQLIDSESKSNIVDGIIDGNEALYEAELPLEKLKKVNKAKKKRTSSTEDVTALIKNEAEVNPEFSMTNNEDTKHADIRSIRKKTNYFQSKDEKRPFQCNICESKFKDPSSLSKHKARHRTEKVHPCPECPKLFYTPFDMKKHLILHSGARPFLCNICGKTYTTSVKLKDHMRRHTDQRDYECPECKKRFYNSSLLANHKLVHQRKSFVCTFCDSRFTFKKGLRNHLKLHENKREYKCNICDAGFNQQAGLFCHKKSKHQIG